MPRRLILLFVVFVLVASIKLGYDFTEANKPLHPEDDESLTDNNESPSQPTAPADPFASTQPAPEVPAAAPKPDPSLTPAQVVKIQLDALQHPDVAGPDTGIAIVFQFAAPDNRRITGPLPRFVTMIKRGFPQMLNFQSATFGPLVIHDNRARQRVTLITSDNQRFDYIFLLSKQSQSPYTDCWMTDGVQPLPNPRLSPNSPHPLTDNTVEKYEI